MTENYSLLGKVLVETNRGHGWVEADVLQIHRCKICFALIDDEFLQNHTRWHETIRTYY